MAGLGKKTWNALDVLTAADVNGYLMDQTVMKFASSTARSSALGTGVSAGMVSFRTDGTAWEGYNGSTWGPLVSVDTSSFLTASSTATLTNKSISGDQITTTVNTISAAYTAVAGDRNETLLANGGSAYTITVPDVFNVGDRLDVIRDGAGTVSLAAGTGVTTWAGAGTAGTAVTFKIDQQYNGATIQKVAANSYRVIGKITA
jgi:hypothetical protein